MDDIKPVDQTKITPVSHSEGTPEIKKLKFGKSIWRRPTSIIFILIFAGLGAYIIFNSSAATVAMTKVWNTSTAWATGTVSDAVVTGNSVGLAQASSAVTTTGTSNKVDLALNRPAYASSTNTGNPNNTTLKASFVDDGSLTTRWGSAYSDPQWIYIDLGTTYNINEVTLNWETAYGKAYEIQVSNNANTWTTIYSTTSGTGGVNDLTGLTGSGRYVRMYGTVRGTQWGYSLWEMSVYGTPTTTSSATNLALNRPAYASSTNTGNPNNTTLKASFVDDGSLTTRWGSAYSDPQWIYIDLGAVYNISEVKLNWETAYGKAYEIQVSNNANTWTTIYSTTNGSGGINDLTGLTGSGRYVRMYGTVRGTQWGYSLWEMSVYGTPSTGTTTTTTTPTTTAYDSSGNITLSYDAGSSVSWTSLTPSSTLPGGTNITYQVRTSTNNSTWSSWTSLTGANSAISLSSLPSTRYIQIQADLSTTNTANTPLLNSLTLGYNVTVASPTVTLSASPTTITTGSSSTLTWSSTNTTSCTASGSWSGTQATSGSLSVSPTTTSTYNLSCSGSGGTATGAATITVNPLSSSPSTGGSGGSSGSSGSASSTLGCTYNGVAAPCIGGATTGASGWGSPVFDDEFSKDKSLNTTTWDTDNGWGDQNGITVSTSNETISGGNLVLTLSSSSSGAQIGTNTYALPVGGFAEARIDFPGNGQNINNWPAWWISGPNWPAAGESDIAEGLGTLTVNYHSPDGASNGPSCPPSGITCTWSNAFHTYGIYRGSNSATVYWDGQAVRTYSTDDNGQPENLILTNGCSGNCVTSSPGNQMLVSYVRAWQ